MKTKKYFRKAKDFRDTKLASLSVAVIINNEYDKCTKIGINDSEFVTGKRTYDKKRSESGKHIKA